MDFAGAEELEPPRRGTELHLDHFDYVSKRARLEFAKAVNPVGFGHPK